MTHLKASTTRITLLRALSVFILLASFTMLRAQDHFSRKQVLEDLDFLRSSLEETHYDLFAYTSRKEFDENFNEVRASVQQDSLSLLEVTSLFQRVISKANNGHTEIGFPGQSYREYAYAGGTVFPLELAFEDGKALVRKNWSGDSRIHAGSEILSINGMPIAEILERIYPQVSAERAYFKNAKIELFSFPRFYWQVYGRQDAFDVGVGPIDATDTYHLKAIEALEGYEMKRSETVVPKRKLKFIGEVAYLNPGNFSGDEKKYRKFIDSAFVAIRMKKSENVIVDLRNNLGGEDAFSDYLVSYFTDKPFTWSSRFTLKTSALLKKDTRSKRDTTKAYWQEVLRHRDGEVYDYPFEAYQPQPREKRFGGTLFVLVNRQSHSQAAVTAAQIQDYGFGTIVGEETGDYPSLYASVFRYELPNTEVSVQVSKGRIVRVNGSTAEQGVIPDIFIRDHLLDEKDEILEGLLERIGTDE